jgi:hypothetical protein
MSVYQARAELDKARKKLNRLEWKIEDGAGWLQGWYRARYLRRRMVWEIKRRAWEEAVRVHREAIGIETKEQG